MKEFTLKKDLTAAQNAIKRSESQGSWKTMLGLPIMAKNLIAAQNVTKNLQHLIILRDMKKLITKMRHKIWEQQNWNCKWFQVYPKTMSPHLSKKWNKNQSMVETWNLVISLNRIVKYNLLSFQIFSNFLLYHCRVCPEVLTYRGMQGGRKSKYMGMHICNVGAGHNSHKCGAWYADSSLHSLEA